MIKQVLLGLLGLVLVACANVTVDGDQNANSSTSTTSTTTTGTGGSGGEGGNMPELECLTDADCAHFNTGCVVTKCLGNSCFAYERDDDGDGHSACGGGAAGSFDCDDNDPKIYPGAKEICGDDIDNDCSGKIDDGCFDWCVPSPDASGAGKGWWTSCCEVNGKFKHPLNLLPQTAEIVKASNGSGVFYVGSDGMLHGFPLMRIFSSWYGTKDAQGIPATDPSICGLITEYPLQAIESLPISTNVTIRPYTFITGIDTPDSSRWISAPHQMLRKMGPGVAESLFPVGSIAERTWLTPDWLFVDYIVTVDLDSAADYDIQAAQAITLEQDLGLSP